MSTDEEQVRELITAMYESVSGPAGPWDSSREWEVFHPSCQMMRTSVDDTGRSSVRIMWSAYEARHHPADETPERRGINSIQVYRDGVGR